jgi:hypothetical protein
MRSNCLIFALRLYARRYLRWRRGGRDPTKQPYIVLRRSRLAPKVVPHILYAERRASGSWRLVSFVPVRSAPLTWRNFWFSALFIGRIKWGDK